MSGKRYTEEFKVEAVKQVVDRGHPVTQVAARLGITSHSLYTWVVDFHAKLTQSFQPNLTPSSPSSEHF